VVALKAETGSPTLSSADNLGALTRQVPGAEETAMRRVFSVALLAAAACAALACSGCKPKSDLIHYEVLKETKRIDGKVFLAVLVDEKASKEDVMKLAESMWADNHLFCLSASSTRASPTTVGSHHNVRQFGQRHELMRDRRNEQKKTSKTAN
jgi:hypothetical protein